MSIHLLITQGEFVRQLDFKIYDFAFTHTNFTQTQAKSSHTVLVDIDEKSLKTLGQWPWPRVVLADLIYKINATHPAVTGLDIIFPEPDRTSPKNINSFYKEYFGLSTQAFTLPKHLQDNDKIFAKSLQRTQSVIGIDLSNSPLSTQECSLSSLRMPNLPRVSQPSYNYALCNISPIQNSVKYVGFVNANKESDGVARRIVLLANYHNKTIPSFSLALLLASNPFIKIGNHEINIFNNTLKLEKGYSFLLRFYPQNWYKKVSASDLLAGKIDPQMLQGKVVIIGSSAIGLHDQIVRTNGITTIGPKIHMTAVDNLLNNDIIIQPEFYKQMNLILSAALTLVFLYLLLLNKNITVVVSSILVLGLYTILTFVMLQKNATYISAGYFYIPFLLNFMLINIFYLIVENYKRRIYIEKLDKSHVALLDAMVHVAEVHDIETGAHIVRTKKYIKALAEHILNLPHHPYKKHLSKQKTEIMYRTAPLHDIGKVGIPDSVLKKPGKLTSEEFDVMKSHPDLGRQIMQNAIKSYEENEFFEMASNIAYTHHEKWDGSGYPNGLKGEEIPLEGRLMALADVYDALISRRVYKESFPLERVYAIIEEGRGTHFDPLLVDIFFEIQSELEEIARRYEDE